MKHRIKSKTIVLINSHFKNVILVRELCISVDYLYRNFKKYYCNYVYSAAVAAQTLHWVVYVLDKDH